VTGTFRWVVLLLLVLSAPGVQAGQGAGEIYVVQRGQTLSVIAHDVLGDPQLWPAIYRANRDQIKDPTVLHVGQHLAIPEVPSDPTLRERIRGEAIALTVPPPKLEGPDVAAAPPGPAAASSTE
jgi:LysM repeat protein